MPEPAALLQAFRLLDQPELLVGMRISPLPEGMQALIRIAGDEAGAAGREHQAATVFLKEVCLFEGADARRRLGLVLSDDFSAARNHHRLLMKWLHPDRNPEHQWLAERVNSAWTALKNSPLQEPAETAGDMPMPMAMVKPRSRFPFFLISLLFGALLFLALSFLPETPIYFSPAEPQTLSSAIQSDPVPMPEQQARQSLSPSPAMRADAKRLSIPEPRNDGPRVDHAIGLPKIPLGTLSLSEPPSVKSAPRGEWVLPVQHKAPTLEDAESVLQQLRSDYRQGNLSGFMQLFSPNAISLRGSNDAIAAEYGRIFRSTRTRDIAFINPRWQTLDDTRRLRAGVLTETLKAGETSPVSRLGNIEILFVQEQGETRILELLVTE